ncbi:MAG: carbohydrate-binding protein [Bacillota bacterium]
MVEKTNGMNEKGVTLIEILVVIVIIGIVGGISFPVAENVFASSQKDSIFSDALVIHREARVHCLPPEDSAHCEDQVSEDALYDEDSSETFGLMSAENHDSIGYGTVGSNGVVSGNNSRDLTYFGNDGADDLATLDEDKLYLEGEYEYYAIKINQTWQIAYYNGEYAYFGNPVLDSSKESHDAIEYVGDDYGTLLEDFVEYLADTTYWENDSTGDYPDYETISNDGDSAEVGDRFIYKGDTFEFRKVGGENVDWEGNVVPPEGNILYSYGPYQEITDEWRSHNTYHKDDTVTHNGKEYIALDEGANNHEPGSSIGDGWNVVVEEGDYWEQYNIYDKGDIVTYEGLEYEAKWYNQNEAPMTSDAWRAIVDDGDEWLATEIYTRGDEVTYRGESYIANYWNKNKNPDENHGPSGSPWSRLD